MQAIEKALIAFFTQVARKDQSQLKKLKEEQRFTVGKGRWCFTLPDLYVFLQREDDVFGSIDYRLFRKLVFSSSINQTTKLFGAELIIADNRAKVDESRYALVWQAKEGQ